MPNPSSVTELKVSGHLMRLEPGLYCVFHRARERTDGRTGGLPAVRISLPPAAPDATRTVEVAGFSVDGWIARGRDAALIRVNERAAQVLVTIYQSAEQPSDPPHLEIVRIGDPPAAADGATGRVRELPTAREQASAAHPGVLAHVQGVGDVHAPFGAWAGERGSRRWIEGFELDATPGVAAGGIEYQAILGHDWVTPWTQAGSFCGSRHMALPVLGLNIRLKEETAARFECALLASFIDGSTVGPLAPGERCIAPSLAPLEALEVFFRPKQIARRPAQRAKPPTITANGARASGRNQPNGAPRPTRKRDADKK